MYVYFVDNQLFFLLQRTTAPILLASAEPPSPAPQQVLAHDNGADGWSGRNFNVSGYSYWTLDAANPEEFSGEGFTADDGAWSGTLLKHHYMSQTRLCLPPGDYRFAAPAYVSRVSHGEIMYGCIYCAINVKGLSRLLKQKGIGFTFYL